MSKQELIEQLEELIENLKSEPNVGNCRFVDYSEANKTDKGSEVVFEIGIEVIEEV